MRRTAVAALAGATLLVVTGTAAGHDHPAPAFAPAVPGPAMTFNSSPPGAWELIDTVATGNAQTDLDFFTKNGEIYASVGTLAVGGNGAGQTIVKLTQNGRVSDTSVEFVSGHGSAFCPSDPVAALGLQHDVEATPKGNVLLNTFVRPAVTSDAQLLVDATDNEGRCHDSSQFGLSASDPQGGLEIIDITNIADPVEIGLTSHIGEAHTVNVDPKRPHIAYAVSSDSVGVSCTDASDTDCKRPDEDDSANTNQGFALDGFEVVDLSSCMNFPALTALGVKRMLCRPVVYRYRWPSALIGMGHTVDSVAGCHELEVYPNDRLTCAAIHATLVFDLSGAFDNNGTPTDYTDDKPRGTPLPCAVRDSRSPAPYATGAKVIDCVVGEGGQDLRIEGWKTIGGPSLEGVRHLGTAFHQGRGGPHDSTADIDVSHEAELTGSGKFVLATDERGGGVSPPGATCAPGVDNKLGNGGIHAYSVDRLHGSSPNSAAEAWNAYARTPTGAKAIYRADVHTHPEATVCTSHVFHQIPGQNRIFMGWYSQGTQVVDFVEHPDGSFEFFPTGYFVPANANTWTSAVFKVDKNSDGTFTYYGATGDFNIGAAGRNAIDVWKVTLPAPRQFAPEPAVAELSLAKTGPAAVKPDKTIVYTLTYENTGNGAAQDVKIVDTLPAGVKFRSASNGGRLANGQVTWTIGTVAPGASGTRTLKVLVPKKTAVGTVLVNRADLTSGNAASPPTATATTTVSR